MNCEIIRDLLPLYCDQVCSGESRRAVEEHAAGCPACRALLEEMSGGPVLVEQERTEELDKANAIKGLRKRISRGKRRSVVVTAAAVLALVVSLSAAADVERPVAYTPGLVTARLAVDDNIDLWYSRGGAYASLRGMAREIDGRSVVFLCYTENLKSGLTIGGEGHAAIGNGLLLDTDRGTYIPVPREVDAVYYLAGDYDELEQMGGEELAGMMDQAVLLWERS